MAAEQTERRREEGSNERIVVALDASPNSVAALRAAAEVASWLGMDLEGLFVEDINLTYLCGFPYQQEVGSYTGAVRRLDDQALRRQLRALAASIQQAMAREAGQRPVRWTFQVRRGSVVTELLAGSQSASMMSLGRTSRRQRTLGSTAASIVRQSPRPVLILDEKGELQPPLTVVYTGTETADRALRLAIRLHDPNQVGIRVLIWAGESGHPVEKLRLQAETIVQQADVPATILVVSKGGMRAILAQETGTLMLPREYAGLLSEHSGPTILVP